MYTVISYNNSRNNGTVKFLEVFSNCVKAIRCARKHANFKYGEQNVTDRISQRFIDIDNVLIQFTSCNEVEMDVFAVITLPAQKDDETASVCSCDEIIKDQENVTLSHKNMCRRRSSVNRKLFIHNDTFVNTTTKEHFHIYVSDVNSQADTDIESDKDDQSDTDIESDKDDQSDADIENNNDQSDAEKNDELIDLDYDDYDDDYDGRYDERYDEMYDDRYDEREDYGYDGGYEDECFECLDL